jgi:hypothetical protein
VFGRTWDEATARDVEAYKDWRLTDLRNGDRVQPTSFDTDRAALNTPSACQMMMPRSRGR